MPDINYPIAGVIGQPITHSLSPLLHHYWLAKMNLFGRYEARDIAVDDINFFFDDLRQAEVGWVGCNVTLPHKIAALENCDSLSPTAKKIGAVNTITLRDKKLYGDNTDGFGFIKNLESWQDFRDSKKSCAVILGAGGAARGVIYGLQALGYQHIVVINRTLDKLQNLQKDFGVIIAGINDIKKYLDEANILVNATSLGLAGEDVPIDFKKLPKGILLHDIIYGATPTPFLKKGRQFGFATRDGLDMFIYQAVIGFKQWFHSDKNPPIDDELRQYLLSCR
ncbi:MAG: shikimate dehydrogenase [Alphaproteobacteria bacterium]